MTPLGPNLLTQRADLEAGTVTNTAGEETVAYTAVLRGVAVLVRPATAPADVRLGTAEEVTHVLYANPIPEMLADRDRPWRFTLTWPAAWAGRRFVVVDPEDAAGRGHHLEIRVRRLP